jgi:inner membrane protein
MDPVTHALSGALFARLLCVRPIRAPMPHEVAKVLAPAARFSSAWDHAPGHLAPWQAMGVAAVAAAFPDIDALALLGGDFFYLRHHRGITHSVLLAPVWAGLIAFVGARSFAGTRERQGGWKALYGLALAGVLLHIAGDWITT